MPSGEQQARKTHCPQGHEYTPENTRHQNKRDRGPVRRSRYCRECDRQRMQRKRLNPVVKEQGRLRTAQWRRRHPDKYREGYERSHAEKKQILDDARKGGCIRCGEDDLACLDFHHRDPREKEGHLGHIRRFSIERIKAEIAKCDVLCANCHRKHHRNERNTPTPISAE